MQIGALMREIFIVDDDPSVRAALAVVLSGEGYQVTSFVEGEAFLAANRAGADEILARTRQGGSERSGPAPAPVVRAMENLKLALRLRFRGGALDEAAIDTIASALDAAARTIERS